MDYFQNIKKVKKTLKPRYGLTLLFVFLCLILTILTISEPILLSRLLDYVTSQTIKNNDVVILCINIIMIFILRIGLGYLKNILLLKHRNYSIQHISESMFSHLLNRKIQSHDKQTSSYFVSRILDELANIDGILDYYLIDGFVSIILCLIIFGLMFMQSWHIALLTLLFVLFDYFVAFKLPLTKIFSDYNEAFASIKSYISNTLQGIKLIKLGNKFIYEVNTYSNELQGFLKKSFHKGNFTQLQRSLAIIFRQFGYLILIIISALLLGNGKLGLGQFTMLISLYNLLWSQLSTAENLIPLYKYGKVTCDRIMEILSYDLEKVSINNHDFIKDNINNIKLDDLYFSYHSGNPILSGINIDARKGKITAIAGYSGCGKSTTLDLLLGFLQPNSGSIYFNETKTNIDTLINYRIRIGYVGQNSFLFQRSLRDNLLYYSSNTLENKLKLNEYLNLFNLNKMVDELPGGLDFILDENANTVSGGEKQRLCIIRELMKNPAILILDEFTAHLDAITEDLLFRVLNKIVENTIIIQIAHKETALKNSDIIYLMDKGKIVEEGNHEELLKKSVYYRKLISQQE